MGPAPRRGAPAIENKNLGFRYLYTFVGGPRKGAMVAGSRPALPGLHDVLCRSRSSGSFGLRVAVVEPSAKDFGVRGLGIRV